ncbi:RNA methyltransferase [Aeromicrobium sp.]|uniref:TrmH family RNA methyltransferase n=1 Tax=Aeromicrobium sp. TaxID=1871063 RepID=UPI0028AE4063|nr:RNA methyltransferase [Aeromicrobium sp.]
MASPGDLTVRSGRVKIVRRLATRAFRVKTGEFVAEGPQAVREALAERDVVIEVFATVEATERYPELEAQAETWHVVTDDVVEAIADSVTPQGLVARCHSVLGTLTDVPADARLVVVCAEIRDPGNLGAVIRCADAAGAAAVVVAGESVDPLNPKVVRATAGSLFHLPIAVEDDVESVIAELQSRGMQVLAADGAGETGLFDDDLDLVAPTAWLMGNEAHGLPDSLVAAADRAVHVPILGRAESLNLATAAAVCLYTSAREQG